MSQYTDNIAWDEFKMGISPRWLNAKGKLEFNKHRKRVEKRYQIRREENMKRSEIRRSKVRQGSMFSGHKILSFEPID